MVAICNSYLCKLYIVFDLNKNLTLKKDNSFSFSSLNRFFALSLYPNCRLIVVMQQTKAAHLYNRKKPIITEEIWHIGQWITLSYLF